MLRRRGDELLTDRALNPQRLPTVTTARKQNVAVEAGAARAVLRKKAVNIRSTRGKKRTKNDDEFCLKRAKKAYRFGTPFGGCWTENVKFYNSLSRLVSFRFSKGNEEFCFACVLNGADLEKVCMLKMSNASFLHRLVEWRSTWNCTIAFAPWYQTGSWLINYTETYTLGIKECYSCFAFEKVAIVLVLTYDIAANLIQNMKRRFHYLLVQYQKVFWFSIDCVLMDSQNQAVGIY